MTSRANQLQFLRFLAFLLIFFFFFGSIYPLSWLPGNNGAAYAVSFFFMLSGFVAAYSRYGKPVDSSPRSIIQYIWKKLKKSYPLYVVTLLFAAVYNDLPLSFTINTGSHLLKPLLVQLLKNLLLIQSWFRTGYFAYNGVGWFLSTIFFLYLITLPALAIINKIQKSKHHVIFNTFMVFAFIGFAFFYAWFVRDHNVEFWGYIFPPARVAEYLIGILLGYLVHDIHPVLSKSKVTAPLTTGIEAGIFLLLGYLIFREFPFWQNRIAIWLFPNIILLLSFGLGTSYFSKLFSWRPLVSLGNISFECFLIHPVIINFYRYLSGMSHTVVHEDTYYYNGNVFSLLYCLGLTLLIAFYVHYSTFKTK